ncbi:hypothetical protein [Flavobacterium soyae]|uniref:hypothetical protein n=1 Tax=Flavobacterium soyae TaxID=2903098 RepID=UPI001E3C0FF2|nr:hypothetical protein [Flavobacterium soyae]MCD9577351.1 hypothetical protein [Flavobacterium soyae]
MITGAAAGFAGGVTGSALNGNSFGQVMLDGAYGGLKGGVFGAAGGYAASFAPAGILNGTAYSISTNLALNGVGNVIEGQNPFQGAGFTIAISGVTGGYQGYRSAQAQGLNTWTGKPNPSVIAKNVTNFEESAQIAYDKAVKIQQEPIDMGNTASKWDTVSSIDGKSGNSVFYKQIDPYSSAGYKSIDVTDLNHSFSKIVDNNMGSATKFTLKGGDGISRSLYQIEGASMKGVNGIFEWIVENGGNCTHRVFIPGAKITGIPNRF